MSLRELSQVPSPAGGVVPTVPSHLAGQRLQASAVDPAGWYQMLSDCTAESLEQDVRLGTQEVLNKCTLNECTTGQMIKIGTWEFKCG